jgi:hypothetical protein
VNVTTSGTPIQLATAYTPCNRVRVSVVAGLTGKMYLGTAAVNHSTLAGVIKELWPNSGGGVDDSYEFNSADGTNSLNLADYWIDAAINGEGLIVAYWTN